MAPIPVRLPAHSGARSLRALCRRPGGVRRHRQQVGQTGARISAELYLAGGISGAIQHMVANREAHRGVSTDPGAPIISHADCAVIGDLNQVIPALTAALHARSAGAS